MRPHGTAAPAVAAPPAAVEASAFAEFAELPGLAAAVRADPAGPAALVALLRLEALAELLGAGPVAGALEEAPASGISAAAALAAGAAALPAPTAALARALRAALDRRLGRRQAVSGLREWRWIGPFDASDVATFERVEPFEADAAAPPPAHGRDGPVAWQPLPAALTATAEDLEPAPLLERPGGSVIHLEHELRLAAPARLRLRLGAAGAARLWLDGVRLVELPAPPPAQGPWPRLRPLWVGPSREVTLAAGVHRLHLKLLDRDGALAFFVEASAAGAPSPTAGGGVGGAATVVAALAAGAAAAPLTEAWLEAWLSAAEARLAAPAHRGQPPRRSGGRGGPAIPADALAALAALDAAGWPWAAYGEAAVGRVADLLARAAEEDDPAIGAPAALAAALRLPEPGDRAAALAAAVERWPALAWLRLRAIDAQLAADRLAVAQRLAADATVGARPAGLEATLRALELWLRAGAEDAALTLLRAVEARQRVRPALAAWLIAARLRAAHDDLSGAAAAACAAADAEPADRRLGVAALVALDAAGDRAAMEARQLRLAAALSSPAAGAEALARARLTDGDAQGAIAALRQVPEALWRSTTFEALARAATATGDRAAAAAALREGLRRAPGRRELRARLLRLQPAEAGDDLATADLLAIARQALARPIAALPLRTVFRRTALRELGPGRLLRYDAEVIVVGRGGPREHRVELEVVPSLASAEVLRALVLRRDGSVVRGVETGVDALGDEGSALYYDLEQHWLRFVDLGPGDVLVLETQVRDFAADPFRVVFGELMLLGETRPIDALEVDIALRPGAQLFAAVTGPQRARFAVQRGRDAGGGATLRVRGQGIAAVALEERMPGAAELVPMLHVSSFASWDAVVAHWAALLRASQPEPGSDPHLRALAQRLTAGAADEAGRIGRLHRFVADEIRYVGLEFGAHSLRPYPVADVLVRRFGDCKDKATLLAALLAEVGIEAQVALVRTGERGRVDPSVASLAPFDHAIVWLPGSDRWLDPTVRHHGPTVLPAGDLGGQALPVPRRPVPGAALRQLPWPGPDDNARDERLDIALAADGSAVIELRLAWTGQLAAAARALLAVEGRRRERLEADLGQRFAGLHIDAFTVEEAAQPGGDEALVLRLRGKVPAIGRRAGGRWILAPLQPQAPLREAIAAPAGRTQPLLLAAPQRAQQEVALQLPPGWRAASLPQPARWQRQGLGLVVEAGVVGDAIALRAELRRATPRVEVAGLDAWRQAVDAADAALGQALVLERTPAAAVATPRGEAP